MAKRIGEDAGARERILRAASSVFAEKGFGGARVGAIACRAGVNKAMLYYHVGDKAALYEAVLLQILAGARHEIAKTAHGPDSPEAKLEAVIRGVAFAAASSPDYPRLMLRELATGGASLPEPIMRQMAGIAGLVRQALREGRRSGTLRRADPLMTHLAILGAVMALTVSAPVRARLLSKGIEVVPGNAFTQAVPDFVAELVLRGLRNLAGSGKCGAGAKKVPWSRGKSGAENRRAGETPKTTVRREHPKGRPE